MKAAYFEEHGEPEVLGTGELPDPEAGEGEVVVQVRAVALNHLDLWTRRGLPGLDLPLPHVGGSDVAGVVASTGPGVREWGPGDRVVVNPALWCGACEWCQRGEQSLCDDFHILGEHVHGGAAERVAVPTRNLYRIPEALDFATAAAAPLVFQTAWRGLVGRGRLRAGETALITAASGGVGTAAVQIARHAGARVFAVTSGPENVERVEALGADRVVDRRDESFSEVAWRETGKRGVDLVFDSVGQATWKECVRALAKRGRLVTYGATTGADGTQDIRRMFWKQLEIRGTTMASRSEFERVMGLIVAGELHPVVDRVWPLERIRDAHERLEAGEQFGKIVLEP